MIFKHFKLIQMEFSSTSHNCCILSNSRYPTIQCLLANCHCRILLPRESRKISRLSYFTGHIIHITHPTVKNNYSFSYSTRGQQCENLQTSPFIMIWFKSLTFKIVYIEPCVNAWFYINMCTVILKDVHLSMLRHPNIISICREMATLLSGVKNDYFVDCKLLSRC